MSSADRYRALPVEYEAKRRKMTELFRDNFSGPDVLSFEDLVVVDENFPNTRLPLEPGMVIHCHQRIILRDRSVIMKSFFSPPLNTRSLHSVHNNQPGERFYEKNTSYIHDDILEFRPAQSGGNQQGFLAASVFVFPILQ
jgi:hypothetical protein